MSNRLQLTQLAASIALVAGSAAFVSSAHAAAPAAGTNISNVASATYTDSTGASKTVNSNIVTTKVLQVGSFTLVADQTVTANKNSLVSLSHTLTNTGNGTDTFTLAASNIGNGAGGDDWDFTGAFKIYRDDNKDGIPDGSPITSVTLAAGESINLIVENTTSATAAADKIGKWKISATNAVAGSIMTATNTDTVKIIDGAVVTLRKSVSNSNITENSSREIEYTLVFQNTGNSTATNFAITDILPAHLTYVSGDKATLDGVSLKDNGSDGKGYEYDATTRQVTLVIPTLTVGTTRTLKFKVTVDTDAPVGKITNTAYIDPDNDPGTLNSTPSNPTDVTVDGIRKGTINDNQGDAYADGEAITSVTTKDDQIVIASIKQGENAIFGGTVAGGTLRNERIVIHNTGNIAEEFDVKSSIGSGSTGFPAGTIINLLRADGVTPFVSTGLIPVGGTYELVAQVIIPANISKATSSTATLTINPKSDPNTAAKQDHLTLIVNEIEAAKVDLHNGNGVDTDGTGSTVGTGKDNKQFVDTKLTTPTKPVNFPLEINNSGLNGDNFNLSHNLPADWDVKFYVADLSGNPTGAPLTNTGNIAGNGGSLKLVAVVTPPAGTPANSAGQEVLFTVTSPATNLSDVMSDKVIVLAERLLTLENNRIDTVAPGGTVFYKHTLTNKGNIVEGATSLPFSVNNDLGWTTSVYVDLNNNGIADANELLTTGDLRDLVPAGLAQGASVNLIIKVQAPVNATVGEQDRVLLTVSPIAVGAGTPYDPTITFNPISNIDLTTVTGLQVRLVKDQALVDCAVGTATTYTQANVDAKPGQCVKYRITAKNEGLNEVTDVVISDNTPNYTTFQVISGQSPKYENAIAGSTPANGGTGTISATKTPLASNATASLEFVIKVDE
ncbi:DUF11 domain-containing protein [Acinetobacter cumulans]|uniref:DUF11 domain-containing protein n=1 Tax=Acinetobacter cumulans TaxID=2136182 RepID=A0ABX9U277_9GAMM|nr:DUF11 domain-containing protein [Acinetobacter cumulans]RLL39042.1 DUF11 domain-containing protein [Acinetobacter cumulans]